MISIEQGIVKNQTSSSWRLTQTNAQSTRETKETKKEKRVEDKENHKPKESNFLEILEEFIPSKKEPELHQLWVRLPEVESELIKNPTEDILEEYKNLVRQIAKLQIEKNVKIQTLKRKNSAGKEFLLSYVKIIDEKLHKMTLAIQSKRNTAFEILRNLREIRGLLIDMRS
ncbi:MAG: DUF327 family protein [Leptospiraceae bacterium]|nr:DUF327 family protein [Leptospiraceae bacterium]MDW7975145.1 DUF327 family protein [Leptospiraceae bacterium]